MRGWVASNLESGRFDSRVSRAIARGWQTLADPLRPLRLPRACATIGVGGATLGGSGKTPLVRECARAIAKDVAIIAHGYGSAPSGPARRVRVDDRCRDVGDEALLLARALPDVPVILGPSREKAAEFAISLGVRALLFDSVLQARPERFSLSLLSVDHDEPFGSGRCPPAGDLLADPRTLFRAADGVAVEVGCDGGDGEFGAPLLHASIYRNQRTLTWATGALGGRKLALTDLRDARVGLVTRLARPSRILRALERCGIAPSICLRGNDHRPFRARLQGPCDVWLTTEKCAVDLQVDEPSRLFVLEDSLSLDPALVSRLLQVAESAA